MIASLNTLIVSSFNRYLDCDPERAQALENINDKILSITIKEANFTLIMQVQNARFFEADLSQQIDASIIVSMHVLSGKMGGQDQNQLLKDGIIEIQGDSHVASVFNKVMNEIEIDWQDVISKYTGDIVAHQITTGAKSVASVLRRLGDNLRLDVRDYLQDDLQIAVTESEVEHFVEQVDDLRARTDRLEARLNKYTEQ
jgi:ubiquinone biosynthesis protein UbiJ